MYKWYIFVCEGSQVSLVGFPWQLTKIDAGTQASMGDHWEHSGLAHLDVDVMLHADPRRLDTFNSLDLD